MKHLKLRYKFGLIMLLLYLPAAVATYLLADVANRSINFAEKELAGARYLQVLSGLHLWIGNHRSSLFSHLYATESTLIDTREKLQQALEQVDLAEQSFGGELSLGTSWPELRREIGKLLNASKDGSPLALEKVHMDVLAEFRQHWQLIGDQSNLILDPDLDSFYLMDAVLLKLPPLLELLNQYRALFADADTRQLLRNPAFILHTLEVMGTDVATAINTAIVNNDALIDVLKVDTDRFLEAFNAGLAAATALLEGSDSNRQSILFSTLSELLSDGYELQNRVDEALMTLLEQRIDRDTRDRWVMLVLVLTVLHLGLIFTILVGKNIISGIKTAHKVALAIADDQLDNAIHATGRDEPGELLQALAVMQQKLNATITSEREKAIVNGRIKQALDSVTSVVLMASDEHKIIYCNNAAVQYFQTYQSELAVELPGFRHEQLLGQAADLFCPGELNKTRDTVSSKGGAARVIDRTIGGRNLRIKASPVYDSTNTALGTVIELTDRTQEVAIENAVSHDVHGLVCAALEGNLSQRIDGHGKPDFLVPVYKGINDMLDICSTVITSTGEVFQRMAAGDFSRSMQIPEGVCLKGDFAHLQQDAQATIEKLTDMIAGVKADACVVGDTAAKAITVNDVLEGNASSSSTQASGVSSGVGSISESVDTIASAAELLNTNIKEITVNTQRSTTVAQDAVKLSHAADANVGELASSSRAIGDMIKVINSIAEQTNLLALNATIEAARAGETGKGFAVVANEVKELAKETAKATEDISQKIRSIQQVSDTAATGIRAIDEIIRQIDTLQQQTAMAMAQQSETTQEISRSISQVASHSGSMTGELSELVKGTHETTAAVNVMKSEVERLSDLAKTMQVQFDRFQLAS